MAVPSITVVPQATDEPLPSWHSSKLHGQQEMHLPVTALTILMSSAVQFGHRFAHLTAEI